MMKHSGLTLQSESCLNGMDVGTAKFIVFTLLYLDIKAKKKPQTNQIFDKKKN